MSSNTGRSSWCSAANASSDSDSIPTARSTRKPTARCTASSSSADLPNPGSPRITNTPLCDARASSSRRSNAAHSATRP